MSLHIAPGLELPDEAVTQTFAVLAKRGMGKTYLGMVMVEEMLKNNFHVVCVDPIGVHWGLRSSADGKSAGLPIIIAGGEHADVPIEPTSGEVLAELIVEQRVSMVIDLSLFRKGEQHRFMIDFAETLYRKNRQAIHLVLDEADEWAPQRSIGDEARMLGAIEDLVRRGRARGIGVTMITQRPAVLNKNVLTQIEVLIAMRLTSPQDRAAIAEWVKYHADNSEAQKMLESLGSLPVGTAWFWSPGWLDIFKKVAVRKRETLDSSSTPKVGEQVVKPQKFAVVDLEKIREQLSSTIQQVESNDPKVLKQQVMDLRKQLADQKPQVKEVRVPVLRKEDIDALQDAADQVTGATDRIQKSLDVWKTGAGDMMKHISIGPAVIPPHEAPKILKNDKDEIVGMVAPVTGGKPTYSIGVNADLRKGELRMLEVLGRFWPLRLTKAQMAFMAKMKVTGGTFSTYYGRLKREGYITEVAGMIEPSDKALAAVGAERTQIPMSPESRLNMWREVLPAGAQKILDVMVRYSIEGLSRRALAEHTGFAETGGTFGSYLGMMRRNNIIEMDGENIRLVEAES